MAKTVELLLTETVENLGIVGDVVKVRTGYARNFLLPRELATTPSDELIKSLQTKRADAEKHLAEQRKMRADTITRLEGYELTLERACNDLGHLYAGVTQREIAQALTAAGYPVRDRDVRLSGAIKRVDHYDVHIKYESDLETVIKLNVKADRLLSKEEKADLEFDNEGNLVQPRGERRGRWQDKLDKGDKGDKGAEAKGDKPEAKPAAEPKAEKKANDPAAIAEEEKPQKATKKPRADVKKDAAKK
jgi:large subunit ribosomal protein L9